MDISSEIISLGEDDPVEILKNLNAVVHAFKPKSNAINPGDLMEYDAIFEER